MPQTSFDLRIERRDTTAILRISGELDLTGAAQLDRCVTDLASNSPDVVVIDLRKVDFMDSTGLRSLLRARALGAEANWVVRLVRGSAPVQKVFELTRVDELFEYVEPAAID